LIMKLNMLQLGGLKWYNNHTQFDENLSISVHFTHNSIMGFINRWNVFQRSICVQLYFH
jgi:hypothetical protein